MKKLASKSAITGTLIGEEVEKRKLMFLSPYYSEKAGFISVSGPQASHFAKAIAGDFNPIHDEDARKFCVPGDLMFALVVERFGIFQSMNFQFLGTVGANVGLVLPDVSATEFQIVNDKKKPVVDVKLAGEKNDNPEPKEFLIREYTAFSGHNFPHILVPLMAENGVMINPARPLVMYESMSLNFDCLDVEQVTLRLSETSLEVDGKRGHVRLHFEVFADNQVVGFGAKKLALGGLQPFDQTAMDQVVADYEAKKAEFLASDARRSSP